MLSVYRRHFRTCKSGHKEETRTSEFDERKKGFKRCDCPIFASGTLDGVSKRQNTHQWEWEPAKVVAAQIDARGNWDGEVKSAVPPQPAPGSPDKGRDRTTIADALQVFLSNREAMNIAAATLRKYRTFSRQITGFADSKGYVMLDQITPADVDLYYSKSTLGPRAKSKHLSTLRAFFRFCVNREFIPKSPVTADLKPPKGSSRVANKCPFTDEELDRIIAACDRIPRTEWTNGVVGGSWSGEDLKDFLFVMLYTGLRISDVCLFHMDRLHGNDVFLRAKKNGGDVYAYLPDWLLDRLQGRARRVGNRPFIMGRSERVETITDTWRRKINEAFALAGKFEEPPTPHRFRHTFARVLLQSGISPGDVADLLGDEEKTIRQHYARWVRERQQRLSGILRDAFADKPKGIIIEMPKVG